MKKRTKTVIAVILCVIALLWLVPSVFVKTTKCEFTGFELLASDENSNTYNIVFSYQADGQTKMGSYPAVYGIDQQPIIGEQGVCHYHTFPPYMAFEGDPPTPVTPLLLFALGVLIYIGKKPKFLSKKKEESTDEQQA